MLQTLAIWLHVWASHPYAILPLRSTLRPFRQVGGAVLGGGAALLPQGPSKPGPSEHCYCTSSAAQRPEPRQPLCPGQALISKDHPKEASTGYFLRADLGRGSLPSQALRERWLDGWRDGWMAGKLGGWREPDGRQSAGELLAGRRQGLVCTLTGEPAVG